MSKAKKLIVGVDPGTSASIAAFDLEGNFIGAETIRNSGKGAIIGEILRYGSPVVIATDVQSPPKFVSQIASDFSARLFAPDRDMLKKEKDELTHGLKKDLENDHERDAASAALNFLKYYKNKMAWIDRNVNEKNLKEFGDEIKTCVLQGVPLSKVIDYLTIKEESEKKETAKPDRSAAKNRAKECSEIKELMESNAKLRSLLSIISMDNKLLNERIRGLEKEFHSGIKADEILKSRDMQIKRLKILMDRQMKEISRLEQSLKRVKGNSTVIGKESKSKSELEESNVENLIEEYRSENDE